jgi:hypothetical protein
VIYLASSEHEIRKRHRIVHRQMSDERANVETVAAQGWKNLLLNIFRECSDDDVYNADETDILFEALLHKSFVVGKDPCKQGKRSKERDSILHCPIRNEWNKLEPLVIGKNLLLVFGKILD